ncbi:amino acid adenylation domain-containing protein [Streptomyces sp. NPDC047981]|uniref:non-ribosomal peptide synthetase n=1 Tax=Streptomyces sp. NPDC047981 TaxID=3154610 RepID=UPI0034389C31
MTATRDPRDVSDVLPDGGTATTGWTEVPPWTTAPVPGWADHAVVLPAALATGLRERAGELGVRLSSIHLAAHAKVLAALSGDPAVTTARLMAPGRCVPCRTTVVPGTWRELVRDAARAEEPLRDGGWVVRLPDASASDRPGAHAAVFDPDGHGPDLPGDAVLCVTVREEADGEVLRLRVRTDALDRDAAARIAGYHLTALRGVLADPDSRHDRHCLLSAREIRFQAEGLAGPRRPLPDRRFHELFEERVRRHPDAVVAVHRGRRWTYRDLNLRANRLARALLDQGLRREEPVGVVLPRDLYWMACVLAAFKAGGAYLPVDPDYPSERIGTMLERAACRFVLTEPGSTGHLDRALASPAPPRVLDAPAVAERASDGRDLGIPVQADALAYVFFTSGSTGEPKGAMVEHAGMLNHLLAKAEDLGIGAETVVAQTASQCFDISLWQLFAGPLRGGRTLLVEQEAVLDAHRILALIAEERVNVLQVVPSYLDVLISALERTRRTLPDLACVSVTGEALRAELVRRWFHVRPGTRLVNAYGLTETSDDTNHEILEHAPADDRVSLGRPIRNVRVSVVDDRLMPVPLGAPGGIAFSGVCVGRGYVNDPDRTAECYRTDPLRPGERLYRGGDFGRWLPDGKLEFLGRRDAQVKIRGFRVEIGDVESALLRVPGVRDGAVVVTGAEGQGRQLVAFHTGDPALGPEHLCDLLGELLPAYMVPASCHRLDALPLTANGKVDRKALGALAETDGRGDGSRCSDGRAGSLGDAPRTATEERLADAWAAVLDVPASGIGRADGFFDLGGTSLTAVRLAVALDRVVSLRDLTACPVLADLAALIDTRAGAAHPAGPAPGPRTPEATTREREST